MTNHEQRKRKPAEGGQVRFHEDVKRSLAQTAIPGPWRAVNQQPWWHVTDSSAQYGVAWDVVGPDTAEHIAFHDPETALLEAEVIEAARAVEHAGATGDWGDDPLKYLRRALAALDALAATRARTDRADAHHAKRNGGEG